MPQDIISQFDRKYNAPLETFRQVVDTNARDSISPEIRWTGMLVYVVSVAQTYQLVGGIDNTDWQPLAGLSDAPSDGNTYGRLNGSWAIITGGGETSYLFSNPDPVSIFGVQTDTIVRSLTVPAGTVTGGGDTIIVKLSGRMSAGSGNGTMNLKLGNLNKVIFNLANTVSDFIIEFNTSKTTTSNTFRYNVRSDYTTTTVIDALGSFTFDPNIDQVIELTITNEDAGGSILLDMFNVQIIKG